MRAFSMECTRAHKVNMRLLPVAPAPPTKKMTHAEYLAWVDEATGIEWVDGEVIRLLPASSTHQDWVGGCAAFFRRFAGAGQAGAALTAPFPTQAALDLPGRAPDSRGAGFSRQYRHRNRRAKGGTWLWTAPTATGA